MPIELPYLSSIPLWGPTDPRAKPTTAFSVAHDPTSFSASTDTGSVEAAEPTQSRVAGIEQQDDPGDADWQTGYLIFRTRVRSPVDMRGAHWTPAVDNAAEMTKVFYTLDPAREGADQSVAFPLYCYDPKTDQWTQIEERSAQHLDIVERRAAMSSHDWTSISDAYGDQCSRCGATREEIDDGLMPMVCVMAERKPPERLSDLEVDGSIGKAMREIMQREGRHPPEWLDAAKDQKGD